MKFFSKIEICAVLDKIIFLYLPNESFVANKQTIPYNQIIIDKYNKFKDLYNDEYEKKILNYLKKMLKNKLKKQNWLKNQKQT